MNASKDPKFYYHAHANAVGGWLKQPKERSISTDASISLAQAGGVAEKRIGRFRRGNIVRCSSAHVHVSGHQDKGDSTWRTRVTATVDDLNVMDIITADRIVAQISVAHRKGGGPPTVSLLGTHFNNLRLSGSPVKVDFRPEAFQKRGSTAGGDTLPTSKDLMQVAVNHHDDTIGKGPHPDWLKSRLRSDHPKDQVDKRGSAICSVVQTISVAAPASTYAHVVRIPDFGNVFLGELLVGKAYFHLTMARVEMGCMAEGDLSLCTAATNGSGSP